MALNGYHITLWTSDSAGVRFFAGGPTHNPLFLPDPNPSEPDYGNPDPWGRLRGSYGKATLPITNTRAVVDDGKPCSCYNTSFEGTINRVNSSNIPYDALFQNSNSLAGTLLRDAGLNVPNTWSNSYWTPAYSNDLNSYYPAFPIK